MMNLSNQNVTTIVVAVLVALTSSSSTITSGVDALATPPTDRRGAFGLMGAAGLGSAFVALSSPQPASASVYPGTGERSQFTGDYDDPQHPNCLRQVKVVGSSLKGDGTRSPYPVIEVTGYDGKPGAKTCTDRPTRDDLWKVQGTVKTNNAAFLDFSPKGGPTKMAVTYEDGAIVFPDGNKWTKVVGVNRGTPERRPKDMTTLKSEE
mmetsp:Transcript_16738/g.19080  ORF Transcript_16738/g.19080 Transcript_16738/m.19080 type:complete len:207 (-) Transcript_16738:33-653(-)